MSIEEVEAYIAKHNDYPPSDKLIKAPTTWIPIKESNPSKLTLHWFSNGVWHPTHNVTFVAWPEAFPTIYNTSST
jgi:hypothetical protein